MSDRRPASPDAETDPEAGSGAGVGRAGAGETGADDPDGRPATGSPDRPADAGPIARIRRGRPPLRDSLALLSPFLAVSTAVFVLAAVAGYLFVGPAVADQVDDLDSGESIVAGDTTAAYLVNNGLVAVAMMGGLGVLTLYLLARNGLLLGTAVRVALIEGLAPGTVVAGIAPHGVVELPALLVAGAVGLLLAWRVGTYALGRRAAIGSHEDERHLAQLFVVVLAAIAVAAAIEAHVTPVLAGV